MKANLINWTQLISYVLIIALSIALLNQCKDDNSSGNLAKKQIERKEKKAFVQEIAKLNYRISQDKDTISILKKSIENLNKKSAKLNSVYKPKIEGVKHYNSTDIAKFYQKTYKVPQGVKTTEFGTCLNDSVAKMNIRDVFEKNLAVKQLALCKNEVKDQQLIIKFKDSTIAKLDTINAKTTKQLVKTETDLNDCQNKPKEKKNRGVWFLIGAVLGGLANSLIK